MNIDDILTAFEEWPLGMAVNESAFWFPFVESVHVLSFAFMVGSAIRKLGPGHYLASLWPHFDVPYGMGYVLKPLLFAIDLMGLLVQSLVLALRLFANMFAGHVVLATILIFIYLAGGLAFSLWETVTFASVAGQVALGLLELFIGVLQAYIFAFLTALFMGMALHPAE